MAFALYIHWPFCLAKCPYCDFNSHVREKTDMAEWSAALLADMAHEAALTGGRELTSIFFGGGTPSLMPPALVAALIEAASRHWAFAPDIEITLEANPSSVEAANFAALASVGINRVSLGLQALDDAALTFLGRLHDAAEGLAALAVAQRHFARVSFDLIYARPDHTEALWQAELRHAAGPGQGPPQPRHLITTDADPRTKGGGAGGGRGGRAVLRGQSLREAAGGSGGVGHGGGWWVGRWDEGDMGAGHCDWIRSRCGQGVWRCAASR